MAEINLDILPKTFYTIDKIGQLMAVRAEVSDDTLEFFVEDKLIKVYFWNDGGGGSSALYVCKATDEAMFVFYDHESPLNAFAFGDEVSGTGLTPYDFQISMYTGLPEHFCKSLIDREGNYSFLNIENPETHEAVLYSTGVVYFDGENWTPTAFYQEMVDAGETGSYEYMVDASWMNIETFSSNVKEYKKYWAEKNDPVIEKLTELEF